MSSPSQFPSTERVKPDYSAIIRPTIQYELYNPRDRWVQFDFDGRPYNIPPLTEKWRGRDPASGQEITYPKPGVMPVWTPTSAPGRGRIEYNARDIVEFACGVDGVSGSVGALGIRPLFGDERDELVEEEAQSSYAERRLLEAQDTIRKHELTVAVSKAEGVPPPFPTRKVQEAYQIRQAIESNISFAAICSVCNMGFRNPNADTQAHLHIIAWHKERKDLVEKAEQVTGMSATGFGNLEVAGPGEVIPRREIPRSLQPGAVERVFDEVEKGSVPEGVSSATEQSLSDPARQVEEQIRKGAQARSLGGQKKE